MKFACECRTCAGTGSLCPWCGTSAWSCRCTGTIIVDTCPDCDGSGDDPRDRARNKTSVARSKIAELCGHRYTGSAVCPALDILHYSAINAPDDGRTAFPLVMPDSHPTPSMIHTPGT